MDISEQDVDLSLQELLCKRKKHISSSLSIGHGKPLHIAKGEMQYLYSKSGEKYLDLVNNVCHVGHCNPHVVKAGQEQMAVLNTNTRYIYAELTEYIERLSKTLPEGLDFGFLVNSGSEANELAIRLARSYTKKHEVVVVDGAYHGHTGMLIDLSPYKFNGPGGKGHTEDWVHIVPVPDIYRDNSRDYIKEFEQSISDSDSISAFIVESILSCAGQISFPEGYLSKTFDIIRDLGGLCISDEVQVGFGRTGSSMWAFEEHKVIPDIVVMGKPIGNGHPMAAVFTTKEIASSLGEMEFFSTFGGNPVSCSIGMAVLDVIENEKLIENARIMGELFIQGFNELKEQYQIIGDVRGKGLFLGIELVKDRETLEPAAEEAQLLIEGMLSKNILLSIDGPRKNVIKIKPPMVISREDVLRTIQSMDEILDTMCN